MYDYNTIKLPTLEIAQLLYSDVFSLIVYPAEKIRCDEKYKKSL